MGQLIISTSNITTNQYLVQLLDEALALLHPVDADDDDPRHGDAPEDNSKEGVRHQR